MASVPTITTNTCPAIEYVASAVLLLDSGDVADLTDKLRHVLLDRRVGDELRANSKRRAEYFYNPANGWEVAPREVVRCIKEGRRPSNKVVPVEAPIAL